MAGVHHCDDSTGEAQLWVKLESNQNGAISSQSPRETVWNPVKFEFGHVPPAATGERRPRCMNAKTKRFFYCARKRHHYMPNLHNNYVSASAAENLDAGKSEDNLSQSSAGEAPTLMKPKRKRSRRPEVHIHKPTRSYSLVQQQQLIHEFVYAEIEYEKG